MRGKRCRPGGTVGFDIGDERSRSAVHGIPEQSHPLIGHVDEFGRPSVMLRSGGLSFSRLESVEGGNVRLDVCRYFLCAVADVEGHGVQGWVGEEVRFGGGAGLFAGGGGGYHEEEEEG